MMRISRSTTCHKCSIDWDLVTVEGIWVKWTHCHVQETSLRWFELCDMVHYPAGISHQKIGTLYSWRDGHSQQQYAGKLWRLNDAQLLLSVQSVPRKNISHTIMPPPPSWTVETRQDGSMPSCSLYQILTLPSECCYWNRDSSDQATFFQSSIFQFWWACANCSLCFLFLADRSGTRWSLLLR